MPLDKDELEAIDRRIQRAGAANCWTGTLGTLATDARRLVRHIQGRDMDYPADHILRGEAELRGTRYLGDEMDLLTEEDAAEVKEETRKAADLGGGVVPAVDEVASRKAAADRMVPSQAEPWKHVPVDLTAWCEKAKASDMGAPKAAAREGTTAKFGTGAVRSNTVEEFRYDLVSPIGLREVARTCAEGAAKYDDFNWERGMPTHDLLNHAIAHIYAFLSGDRSEPHLPHAAWNLLAAIHSHELWPTLNDGHLRRPGCCHPSAPPPG